MPIPVVDPPPGADIRAHWIAEARRVAQAAAELAGQRPTGGTPPKPPAARRTHPTAPERVPDVPTETPARETATQPHPAGYRPVDPGADSDPDHEQPWFADDGTWVDP